MGSIVITQVQDMGTLDDRNQPVYDRPLVTTANASTTTTGVQVATSGQTQFIRVHCITGAHRVNVNSTATTDADTVYYYVPEGGTIDIAVIPGKNFVYRANA